MENHHRASEAHGGRLKEVKVRIPLAYHLRLHSMKVLTGKPISDAVTEALARYFAHEETEAVPVRHVPLADLDDASRDPASLMD